VGADLQVGAAPGAEEMAHVDSTASTLGAANSPVLERSVEIQYTYTGPRASSTYLLEGPGALDGRLVGTGALAEFVRAALGGSRTNTAHSRRRVPSTEVFDHIVLNQRIASLRVC
jgi:hypothetical protein